MRSVALMAVILLMAMPSFAEDTVLEKDTNTTFDKYIGDSPKLTLLGVAPRTKWFFKVYGVGIYADMEVIETMLADGARTDARVASACVYSKGQRALVLKFVRDLSKEKISSAFKDGIIKSIKLDDPRIKDDAAKLLAAFTEVKKGDEVTMLFNDDEIVLIGNGKEHYRGRNKDLARAMLNIYIGNNPIDKDIKKGLTSLYQPPK